MAPPGHTVTRPTDDGFYMPAEWYRHARTWAAWPSIPSANTDDYTNLINAPSHLIRTVQRYEPVIILAAQEGRAVVFEHCGSQVDILTVPHNSIRLRDTGPTFLVDGKGGSAAADW